MQATSSSTSITQNLYGLFNGNMEHSSVFICDYEFFLGKHILKWEFLSVLPPIKMEMALSDILNKWSTNKEKKFDVEFRVNINLHPVVTCFGYPHFSNHELEFIEFMFPYPFDNSYLFRIKFKEMMVYRKLILKNNEIKFNMNMIIIVLSSDLKKHKHDLDYIIKILISVLMLYSHYPNKFSLTIVFKNNSYQIIEGSISLFFDETTKIKSFHINYSTDCSQFWKELFRNFVKSSYTFIKC